MFPSSPAAGTRAYRRLKNTVVKDTFGVLREQGVSTFVKGATLRRLLQKIILFVKQIKSKIIIILFIKKLKFILLFNHHPEQKCR